ncbi:VanZ family protein [Flavobacterium psychrotrophum]|uniref:VanZ family protein n=1 Tax=Flavobacterium psychrotrophum TaxID=2294119 RepID=UPI000E319297|nr:VanZ family protein [Flavobacterium psychrotrophum]
MRKLYFWAAISLTVFITVACLVSMRNFDDLEVVEDTDKYVHLAFYFVFTFTWYQYLVRKFLDTPKFKIRLYTFLWAFLYGVFIEICQGAFTKDRSADFNDIIANSSGALLATVVLWLLSKLKKS